jgi:hypothetical protein
MAAVRLERCVAYPVYFSIVGTVLFYLHSLPNIYLTQALTPQQARKTVNYAESSDDEDPFHFENESRSRRPAKRRAVVDDEDEDDYEEQPQAELPDDEGPLQT